MQFTDKLSLNPEILGQRIRQARERQGLSQEELAAALGLGQRAISELENGKRRLPITDLPDLARHLDVSLLYFFGENVEVDDLDQELLQYFHRLSDPQSRVTILEIVRLLSEKLP